MKFLKYLFLLSICFTACNDEEALPYVEFEDLNYGAYPRIIDGINGTHGIAFSKDDVANSSIDFTVEFYDENQGANVSAYSWSVVHSDGSTADLGTILAAAFERSPSGLPSATLSFSFEQVLKALNKSIDDVAVDERFVFEGTVTKTDGSKFNSQNSSGSIQSTAGTFRGLFQIVVPIIE